MAAPSSPPRRITSPGWLDLRLVLGVVLVLAAVLFGATLVSRAGHTTATVAATRDLAAGTVLRPGDLTTADVRLPGDSAGVYLENADDAVGQKLARDVFKGELLPAAAVTRVTSQTTVTVPFAAGAAPDLRAGQRIEVWVSTASCASVVLLDDVTVQDVRSDTNGSFGSGSDGQDVVISVAPDLAGRVISALAIDQAQIRAGVLVGDAPTPAPSTSAAQAPNTAGQLPRDLAACVTPSGTR